MHEAEIKPWTGQSQRIRAKNKTLARQPKKGDKWKRTELGSHEVGDKFILSVNKSSCGQKLF